METLAYVRLLAEGGTLSFDQAKELMLNISGGAASASEAQMGAALTALSMREPTVDELSGFVSAMRERVVKVEAKVKGKLVDMSRSGTYMETIDISTICGFVAAGAGATVAKHGNRTVAGVCGPADLIEALGADIMLDSGKIAKSLETVGLAFLFAPVFHPSMKWAAQVRKQLRSRTIFSMLGPLTNPAGIRNMVVGASSIERARKTVQILKKLEYEHALVISGAGGCDFISPAGINSAIELAGGDTKEITVDPDSLAVKMQKIDGIGALEPNEAAKLCKRILGGERLPARNVIVANSAALIYIAGLAGDLSEGAELARKSIDEGKAAEKLATFVEFSNSLDYYGDENPAMR